MVEAEHATGDVDKIVVTAKKVMDPKEIALFLLLHLNEDFDEDLLQDAITNMQFDWYIYLNPSISWNDYKQ